MSAQSALHLVDENGEVSPDAPSYPQALQAIGELELKLRRAQDRISGLDLRIIELQVDREQRALEAPERPQVEVIHKLWKKATGKRRQLHFEDREAIAAAIRKLGFALCIRALAGAKYDPYTRRLRNGTVKRYNDLETIFKSYAKVIDFAERAPKDWKPDAVKIAAVAAVEVEWVREQLRQRDVGAARAA